MTLPPATIPGGQAPPASRGIWHIEAPTDDSDDAGGILRGRCGVRQSHELAARQTRYSVERMCAVCASFALGKVEAAPAAP